MNAQEIMKSLQAPFPSDDIEWRVGSTTQDKTKGLALGYVTNRAIQNRLDEVFGPFGWKNEFKEWKGTSQLCGISIKFEGEWITKWDGADDSQTEAVKGGLSDSMKRAAYQWGIGRYLYKLPQVWMPLKSGKYLDGTPKLPEWALPEDEKGKPASKPQPKKQEPDKSKLIVVFSKWELLGGTKESFAAWLLTSQQKHIEDLTPADIDLIEEKLTKKLMEQKSA